MIVIPVFELCIALAVIIIGSCIGSAALVGLKLEKVTKERDAAWRLIERMKDEK